MIDHTTTHSSAPRPLVGDTSAAIAEARVRASLQRNQDPAAAGTLSLRLGLCLAAQQRDNEAREAFDRASRDNDPNTAIRALLQMLRLDGSENAVNEALERAAKRLSAATHPAAVADVADALLAAGQRPLAISLLERVLAEAPPPAPRGDEHVVDRRARALAALRLAELRANDPDAAEAMLQEAVDANESSVTPIAALQLARLRIKRLGERTDPDELLRIAWAYDHPQASPAAGRLLAELCESRGQNERALELVDELIARGDEPTKAWASERRTRLSTKPPPPAAKKTSEELLTTLDEGARRLGGWLGRWAERRLPSSPGVTQHLKRAATSARQPRTVNTLVVGAGSGARRLIRELNPRYVTVVGLIDDYVTDPVGEHEVLGRIDELEGILAKQKIEQVILAIPSATPDLRFRVGTSCATLGVWFRVMPNPFELLYDRDYVRQLRPLRFEETFGPDTPIVIDPMAGDAIRNKSVLIVGAGGCIGSELARQVVGCRPRHVTLVDRAEPSLLEVARELQEERRFAWTFPVIADVVNRSEIRAVMQSHQPDIVFLSFGMTHAELVEESIVHAARVNVVGSWICAEEAIDAGAEQVVLVSGDNAAHCRGPFDWTRALAERAVLAVGGEDTSVRAVRLSNVFETAGSVVARFERQVRKGGPLTVINAGASRRFLHAHEAAQWLLRATTLTDHRAVYAVEDGVDIDILDLAQRCIALRRLEPNRDLRIAFRPPRHSEKTSVALYGPNERLLPTALSKFARVVGQEWNADELLAELRRVEPINDAAPADVKRALQQALGLLDGATSATEEHIGA
jgi:FlaA1/EpsC-like NDP-sugar epimerase/tetratricopeptide (TPR) repeat protein